MGKEEDGKRQAQRSQPGKPRAAGPPMPPPGLRGQPERPPTAGSLRPLAGKAGGKVAPETRPTPVRVAMEGAAEQEEAEENPSRTFQAMGHEWLVRLTGSSTSGARPSRTVPLMQLEFSRTKESTDPPLIAVEINRPLEELSEDALRSLLEKARPAAEDEAEPEGNDRSRRSSRRRR